jgi:hypothetical protein
MSSRYQNTGPNRIAFEVPALTVGPFLDPKLEATGGVGDLDGRTHRDRLHMQGLGVLVLEPDRDGKGLGVPFFRRRRCRASRGQGQPDPSARRTALRPGERAGLRLAVSWRRGADGVQRALPLSRVVQPRSASNTHGFCARRCAASMVDWPDFPKTNVGTLECDRHNALA